MIYSCMYFKRQQILYNIFIWRFQNFLFNQNLETSIFIQRMFYTECEDSTSVILQNNDWLCVFLLEVTLKSHQVLFIGVFHKLKFCKFHCASQFLIILVEKWFNNWLRGILNFFGSNFFQHTSHAKNILAQWNLEKNVLKHASWRTPAILILNCCISVPWFNFHVTLMYKNSTKDHS